MKNKIKKIIGISFVVILISFTTYQISFLQQEKQDIVGTWVEEENINWKLEFTSQGKCFWYYTGEPTEEYTYSIESTSPQCGLEVDTGNNFSYLILSNIKNDEEKLCYEILSLNGEFLQIRVIDKGGFIRFKKN